MFPRALWGEPNTPSSKCKIPKSPVNSSLVPSHTSIEGSLDSKADDKVGLWHYQIRRLKYVVESLYC